MKLPQPSQAVVDIRMEQAIQLLDIVALTEDLPEHDLCRGQVGTIVEELAPDVYEVEFSDTDGRTYALAPIHASQCLKLHDYPAPAAPSTS